MAGVYGFNKGDHGRVSRATTRSEFAGRRGRKGRRKRNQSLHKHALAVLTADSYPAPLDPLQIDSFVNLGGGSDPDPEITQCANPDGITGRIGMMVMLKRGSIADYPPNGWYAAAILPYGKVQVNADDPLAFLEEQFADWQEDEPQGYLPCIITTDDVSGDQKLKVWHLNQGGGGPGDDCQVKVSASDSCAFLEDQFDPVVTDQPSISAYEPSPVWSDNGQILKIFHRLPPSGGDGISYNPPNGGGGSGSYDIDYADPGFCSAVNDCIDAYLADPDNTTAACPPP